jgi:hypothetical protein
MDFKNSDEIKKFSKILQREPLLMGEMSLANELSAWDEGSFTTSSEFLGEMKLILEKAARLKTIDEMTRKDVHGCLSAINRAFSQ